MTISQKRGGYAAFTIAATAILMFMTVMVGVGAEAMADPSVIASLVMSKLGPLAFIEVLKIIQGIATIVLAGVIQSLWQGSPTPLLRAGTLAGYAGGVFLILAGVAGLVALGAAEHHLDHRLLDVPQHHVVDVGRPLAVHVLEVALEGAPHRLAELAAPGHAASLAK